MTAASEEITSLLAAYRDHDHDCRDRLYRLVEQELRRIAESHLRRERSDHTLQATVLVNDAFLQLVSENQDRGPENRLHFYRAAARAIRHILVDHERTRRAQKRGGAERRRAAIEPDELPGSSSNLDLLALDEALAELGELDPRQAQVVELFHFGGRTLEETAEILGVSRSTVKGDWAAAKAWLKLRLKAGDDHDA